MPYSLDALLEEKKNRAQAIKAQRKKEQQDRFEKVFLDKDDVKTKRTVKGEILREGLSGLAGLFDLPVMVGNIGTWANNGKSLPYPSELTRATLEKLADVENEPKTEAQKLFGKMAQFGGSGIGGTAALKARPHLMAKKKIGFPEAITPPALRNRNPNLIEKVTPKSGAEWAGLLGAGAGAGYASTLSDDPLMELGASIAGGKTAKGLAGFRGWGDAALNKKAQLINALYDVDPAKYEQLTKLGITPSLGAVGNVAAKRAEDALLNLPIGQKHIAPIRKQQFEQIKKLSEPFEKRAHAPNEAGEVLRESTKAHHDKSYNKTEKLRQLYESMMPDDVRVKNKSTGTTIHKLTDKGTKISTQSEWNTPHGKEFARVLKDFVENEGSLPVKTANYYRERLFDFLDPNGNLFVGDKKAGAIKAVRGALQKDIQTAIEAQSPEAAKAVAKYKKAYATWSDPKTGSRKLEEKVLSTPLGHDVFTKFESGLTKGNTRLLDVMVNELPEEEKFDMVSSYLKRLGKKGEPGVDLFGASSKWKGLPSTSQQRLLGMLPENEATKLSDVFGGSHLLREVLDKANHSGTSHSLLSWISGPESGSWAAKPFMYMAMKEKAKHFSDPRLLEAAAKYTPGQFKLPTYGVLPSSLLNLSRGQEEQATSPSLEQLLQEKARRSGP